MWRLSAIILLIFVSSNALLAQSQTVLGGLKVQEYKQKDFGLSELNVQYQTAIVTNPKNKDKVTSTITELRISKGYSLFADGNQFPTDSIMKAVFQKGSANMEDFSNVRRYKVVFKPVILKETGAKNYTFISNTGIDRFKYSQELPKLLWKITPEKKTILSYEVTQATVEFGGRKWTAWFSGQLASSDGPYIFGGLPGLILELYDSKEHYHFTAIGISKKPLPLYLRDESEIKMVSRDQFRNAEAGYYENPGQHLGGAYNQDGSAMTFKARPYNPIELK